jgi:hypothetical protein
MEQHSSNSMTPGSERSFGLVMAACFAVIAAFPAVSGGSVRLWAVIVAAVLLVLGLCAPRLLRPFNVAWFRLGLAMHRVMTPLVMAVVYFLVMWPTALLLRLRGRDALRLRRDGRAASYWVARVPPPSSMKNQF